MGGGGDDRRQQRRTDFHVRPDWLWPAFDSEWIGDGLLAFCAILLSGFLGALAMGSRARSESSFFGWYVAFVFAIAVSFFVGYPFVSWLRALRTRHRAVCFLYEAALAPEPDQAVIDTDDTALLLVLVEWRYALRLHRYQHLWPHTLLALSKALLLCPDVVDAVRFPWRLVTDDDDHRRIATPAASVNVDCARLEDRRTSAEEQIDQLIACIRRAVLETPSRWRD